MKYTPPISLPQLLAYPSSSTGCGFCDAVAEVLQDPTIKRSKTVAARMQIKYQAVYGGVLAQTGMPLTMLLNEFRFAKIKEFIVSHPRMSALDTARHFGFSSSRALWAFLKRRGYYKG